VRQPREGKHQVEPEIFGPYRLDDLIGRGGMGEVHRAFDTVKKRTVALKRLRREFAADEGFQRRFRRECEQAARLSDPHVIPIHDYGEIDGILFLDMRFVRGTDFARLLRDGGPVPAPRAVHLIAGVASALDAAHADGLIHRDVKPSNALTTGEDHDDFVYLVDFGIVASTVPGSTSLTATGSTVGTLEYMAPERFGNGPHDHHVDIYALGCLLHEMLTGSQPFPSDSMPALLNAHLNAPPPRPTASHADLPARLDDVVARAMAKDPADRFATAGELARAARSALTGPSPAVPPRSTIGRELRASPSSTPPPEVRRGGTGPGTPPGEARPRSFPPPVSGDGPPGRWPGPDGAGPRAPFPRGPHPGGSPPPGPLPAYGSTPPPGPPRRVGTDTPPPADVAAPDVHRRRRRALLVAGLALVLLLVAGGGIARSWVLGQYYVGASDGKVTVYQGVRGTFLGVPLQQEVVRTNIALTDLPEATRAQVQEGIVVPEGGLPGAYARVDQLRGALLPPCTSTQGGPQPPDGAQPGVNCRAVS
jgi:serine/threonine kinase PknH